MDAIIVGLLLFPLYHHQYLLAGKTGSCC